MNSRNVEFEDIYTRASEQLTVLRKFDTKGNRMIAYRNTPGIQSALR